MNYAELRKINVNEHIERKNGLSYLSWSWAVDQLLQLDETATWEYSEPKQFGETLMVFCTVHAFAKSRTAQLPVMDFRNKAIPNPDAFSVNTAMQRCLAKAISLHGIGLYIYSGEDLPEKDTSVVSQIVKPPVEKVTPTAGALDKFNAQQVELLHGIAESVEKLIDIDCIADAHHECESLESDEKVAVWSLLGSKARSALKKHSANLKAAA